MSCLVPRDRPHRGRAAGLLALCVCLVVPGCSDATHTVATLPSSFGAPSDGRSDPSFAGSGGDGDGVVTGGGSGGGAAGSVDPGVADKEPIPVDVPGETGTCDYPTTPTRIDVGLIVDTYITLLPTGSLDRTLKGIADYVDDPRAAGTGVGTIFVRNECDPDAYDPPDAKVGLLPGHAAAIKASFPVTNATTVVPMAPAVASAVAQARARATARPDRKQILILATDALAFGTTACNVGDDDLETIARDAFQGTPSIPLYVVQLSVDAPGIPILPDTPLDSTAAAGGTAAVRIASLTQLDSVQGTLNQIRTEALPCEYAIPEATVAGEARLVLNYGMSPVEQVANEAMCDASPSGFYYDDAAAPTTLVACASTCGRIRFAGGHESVAVRGPCPAP